MLWKKRKGALITSVSFVIMAAGLGSRYGGIKQMDGVGPNGEILLEYAVYDALEAGYDRIVVILRSDIVDDFRERIGRRLERHVPISYAVQDYSSLPAFYSVPALRTRPFGTVHAVLAAKDRIDGAFAVLNADDYYGRSAFRELFRELPRLRGAGDACMVAYELQRTVSPFGSVNRGLCEVADSRLLSIEETRRIELLPSGVITAQGRELSGDLPVSMNLWGFSREALEDMERYFSDFLRALPEGEEKAECLLPDYVRDRLREKALEVRVLHTTESWFGMTYRDDRASAAECLRQLHEQGVYPPVLFG